MNDRPQPPARRSSPGGFDFTWHAERLCRDMVARVAALRHVDMDRVAVSFSQTRRAGGAGTFATLTPLRFAGGERVLVRRGRRWTLPALLAPDGREMLYILSFYLPRFLELSLDEKIDTTAHELWHISPRFNGDVRRYAGRCFAHSGRQSRYDAEVARVVRAWRAASPPEEVWSFLRMTFSELQARHGRVIGRKLRPPKLVPVE